MSIFLTFNEIQIIVSIFCLNLSEAHFMQLMNPLAGASDNSRFPNMYSYKENYWLQLK